MNEEHGFSQDDRDILIETRTLVRTNFDQFVKHVAENAATFEKVDMKLTAAHRRLDTLSGRLLSSMLAACGSVIVAVVVWMLKNGGIK